MLSAIGTLEKNNKSLCWVQWENHNKGLLVSERQGQTIFTGDLHTF